MIPARPTQYDAHLLDQKQLLRHIQSQGTPNKPQSNINTSPQQSHLPIPANTNQSSQRWPVEPSQHIRISVTQPQSAPQQPQQLPSHSSLPQRTFPEVERRDSIIDRLPVDDHSDQPITASFQNRRSSTSNAGMQFVKQILQPNPLTLPTRQNLGKTLKVITDRLVHLEERICKQKTAKSSHYSHIAEETVRAKTREVELAEKQLELYKRQIQELKWELSRKQYEELDLEAERYFLTKYGHFNIQFKPKPHNFIAVGL